MDVIHGILLKACTVAWVRRLALAVGCLYAIVHRVYAIRLIPQALQVVLSCFAMQQCLHEGALLALAQVLNKVTLHYCQRAFLPDYEKPAPCQPRLRRRQRFAYSVTSVELSPQPESETLARGGCSGKGQDRQVRHSQLRSTSK